MARIVRVASGSCVRAVLHQDESGTHMATKRLRQRAGNGVRFRPPGIRSRAGGAERRMTPARRALFRRILSHREAFGEPMDVNALIRGTRDDA